ncbi:MAG: decaprenyl-phosphate phosphoribosyltransferase [Spartobacteria bacterium]|nr:decaprenyl-phosphate phosphoribosyltransferase [Spartobacteria bacterium]
MRPQQWTKNALVFAAFIFALGDRQQQVSLTSLWQVAGAAFLFSLISSGIYLLNDIRDVELDRAHPTKRFRPIAAGELSIPAALTLSVLLLIGGLGASLLLSARLAVVCLAYVILQVAYTLGLKRVALIDLFVIAAGFIFRALAGAVVLDVTISPWLLLCTMLLALFLGLCKRRHEKVVLSDLDAETRPSLENYNQGLLDQLIGIVSSATIVCYALYTLWPDTVEKFGTTRLGFTIPFVIFGLFRYLDLVYRHEKGDRPERILLTDPPLIIDLFLYGLTVLGILAFR